jgi:hypothetical protein
MMKILAIENEIEGKRKEEFLPHLRSEASEVWCLYQDDVIREIYFDNENQRAILILECKDEKEAKERLSELPLVKEKLIQFEVITLSPYPGYSRLFK